jgi:hypothetical protein
VSGGDGDAVDMNLQVGLSILVAGAVFAATVSPALAWWQFVANSPGGQRHVSPRYATQSECESALKLTESKLAEKYPELYPLVGSCEEYR